MASYAQMVLEGGTLDGPDEEWKPTPALDNAAAAEAFAARAAAASASAAARDDESLSRGVGAGVESLEAAAAEQGAMSYGDKREVGLIPIEEEAGDSDSMASPGRAPRTERRVSRSRQFATVGTRRRSVTGVGSGDLGSVGSGAGGAGAGGGGDGGDGGRRESSSSVKTILVAGQLRPDGSMVPVPYVPTVDSSVHKFRRVSTNLKHIIRTVHTLDSALAGGNEDDKRDALVRTYRALVADPSGARTDEDVALIMHLTKNVKFFKEMKGIFHYECCRVLRLESFRARGLTIVKQDSVGDRYYIILSGSVSVFVRSKDDPDPKRRKDGPGAGGMMTQAEMLAAGQTLAGVLVARLGVGDGFGELALTRADSKRAATVITDEPTDVLTLSREDYTRILRGEDEKKVVETMRFLRSVAVLRALPEAALHDLAQVAKRKVKPIGSVLIKEGMTIDRVDFLTIVKRGEARVSKLMRTRTKTTDVQMCMLGSRQAIVDVESVHVLDEPRLSQQQHRYGLSVVATTSMEVLCVSRYDFLRVIFPHTTTVRDIVRESIRVPSHREFASLVKGNKDWTRYKEHVVKSVVAAAGTGVSEKAIPALPNLVETPSELGRRSAALSAVGTGAPPDAVNKLAAKMSRQVANTKGSGLTRGARGTSSGYGAGRSASIASSTSGNTGAGTTFEGGRRPLAATKGNLHSHTGSFYVDNNTLGRSESNKLLQARSEAVNESFKRLRAVRTVTRVETMVESMKADAFQAHLDNMVRDIHAAHNTGVTITSKKGSNGALASVFGGSKTKATPKTTPSHGSRRGSAGAGRGGGGGAGAGASSRTRTLPTTLEGREPRSAGKDADDAGGYAAGSSGGEGSAGGGGGALPGIGRRGRGTTGAGSTTGGRGAGGKATKGSKGSTSERPPFYPGGAPKKKGAEELAARSPKRRFGGGGAVIEGGGSHLNDIGRPGYTLPVLSTSSEEREAAELAAAHHLQYIAGSELMAVGSEYSLLHSKEIERAEARAKAADDDGGRAIFEAYVSGLLSGNVRYEGRFGSLTVSPLDAARALQFWGDRYAYSKVKDHGNTLVHSVWDSQPIYKAPATTGSANSKPNAGSLPSSRQGSRGGDGGGGGGGGHGGGGDARYRFGWGTLDGAGPDGKPIDKSKRKHKRKRKKDKDRRGKGDAHGGSDADGEGSDGGGGGERGAVSGAGAGRKSRRNSRFRAGASAVSVTRRSSRASAGPRSVQFRRGSDASSASGAGGSGASASSTQLPGIAAPSATLHGLIKSSSHGGTPTAAAAAERGRARASFDDADKPGERRASQSWLDQAREAQQRRKQSRAASTD